MHIIVPMSGMGERFRRAGYKDPKPLIKIDGKPIIEHIVASFYTVRQESIHFTFICNATHLKETNMQQVLQSIIQKYHIDANIVEIANHKFGPVYAVLQIADHINDNEEVIITYCDFGTYWDFDDFLFTTRSRKVQGSIVAYRGFHPHMLGSTNYAFMRDDGAKNMLEIKEKEPFSDNRMEEYASNGIYYFSRGEYVKHYFAMLIKQDINIKGEYYVSLVYNLMRKENLTISIYEVDYMLQWGTPEDVTEYRFWSEYFESIILPRDTLRLPNTLFVLPLSGLGSRFANAGYELPKPLLPISGKPMVVQACESMPQCGDYRFIVLQEHICKYSLEIALSKYHSEFVKLNAPTQGGAESVALALENISIDMAKQIPLLIAPCDNTILYNPQTLKSRLDSSDVVIFTFRHIQSMVRNPKAYGWVENDGEFAKKISVKIPISDNSFEDHAIVGAFWYKNIEIYKQCYEEVLKRDLRVNGEYYTDSVAAMAIELGYKVKIYEVEKYICFGTPADYETFRYFQSFFHKCPWHKYTIDQDPTIEKSNLETLRNEIMNLKIEALQ